MLQERIPSRTPSRRPVPIVPTLVISVGKYGREVGKQLAARLLLTEDGLRQEGLARPLLVRKDAAGDVNPGLIRIVELDWDRWFASNFAPDMLLKDIEVSSSRVAEEGTPQQVREDNRHPDDWIEARQALPLMIEQLFEVSLPLRTHDTPIRIGSFLPQGQEQDFTMRLFVVCAAREADSAMLIPDLIQLLGKAYVIRAGVTKGIQILCYVGGTSRAEHLRAGGDDARYNQLLDVEVDRILPLCRRVAGPTGTPQQESLLDQLNQLWQQSLPQTIEACYLIDSQLANKVAAVQSRLDEPDEAVVASALALNMFITSNGDKAIRRGSAPRWDLNSMYAQPGLFTSFGVASYALDHPQLRRLVYNSILGMFLLRVQPIAIGDRRSSQQAAPGARDEELFDNPELDTQLNYEVEQQLTDFADDITWKTIQQKIPPSGMRSHQRIDYRKVLASIEQVDPRNRVQLQREVERITAQMAADMSDDALIRHIHERQELYRKALASETLKHHQALLNGEEAPLTQAYRFITRSLALLEAEAQVADAPQMTANLLTIKQTLANEANLRYNNEVIKCILAIKRQLMKKPRKIGAFGRSLLLAPLCVLFLSFLSPLWEAIAALFPVFMPILTALSAFPTWVESSCLLLPLSGIIFLAHRRAYLKRIRQQLQQVVATYEAILQECEREGWKLALTQTLIDANELNQRVRSLCCPAGIIATVRDECLSEEFIAQDRILERVFFDDYLKQELKEVSLQLVARGRLWHQRQSLLQHIIEHPWTDQNEVSEWLRTETEKLYRDDAYMIVNLISEFLHQQPKQRLEEMWRDLSNTVVHFLRRTTTSQDDAAVEKKMFCVHAIHDLQKIDEIVQKSDTEAQDSADRLRWIFIRVQIGLHLDSITFSLESLIP